MKRLILGLLVLNICASAQNQDSLALQKIYNYYLLKSDCYSNLEFLTTKIGNRLSGSKQAEQAVEWARKAMYAAGADTVFLQPCKVTHWLRGKKEKCVLTSSFIKTPVNLKCLALGNSTGTGTKGITANVIEVSNFDDLKKLGRQAIQGKIVFYNVFFDQTQIRTGNSYGGVAMYRSRGASLAASYGAVASVVRSMTSVADDVPHTGNMNYDTTVSPLKIPAFALSYIAASQLSESLKQDKNTKLYLESHCQTLPLASSFNVIGQINGSEKPNEYIIAGGHLDSWDVGHGAHDNGTGVVQSIAILSMYKNLQLRPKHSIRTIAFMNEENGLAGGRAYATKAIEKKEKHLAALETDAGGFTPRGFGIDTTAGLYDKVILWKNLFAPYQIHSFDQGGGGADLSLLKASGVPCISFEPDSQRYFDIHHTENDTFDKVNKRELELGAATIGSLIYLLDMHY